MSKIILCLSLVFPFWLFSQTLVINELDCDTPGIDDKEFLELKSQVPNYPLDGYVVVFFNGSASGGNTSYLFLNLDGYKTDINGIFLIGSTTVVPFPQYIIPQNVIQNGEDAVAVYKTNSEIFIESTLAFVDETLIDVLIYGTNDPDAQGLIDIYKAFNPNIKQINEGSANNINSIQRNNDGTYFTGTPTPRRPNDGGGIILNGLLSSFSKKEYNEGDTVNIIFTTEKIIEEDLFISFSLDNGTFNSTDYLGQTSVIMSKGTNTASTSLIIIDDILDEGDEEMLFLLADLPEEFLILNNNVIIRVVDNDYRVSDYGTPIKPTYDKIQGTQPSGYYDSLNGKSSTLLRQSIQDIIANQNVVRAQTYADVINILTEADQNPENSNQVWMVYLEKGRAKLDLQTGSNNTNVWNREHTWPRSRG